MDYVWLQSGLFEVQIIHIIYLSWTEARGANNLGYVDYKSHI